MKYTIEGFSQQALINKELDYIDALFLRYFVDFMNGGRMTNIDVEGTKFYWLDYKTALKELPILKATTRDFVYRHFKKMVDKGILKHHTKKQGGTYSYYCLGSAYGDLLEYGTVSEPDSADTKPEGHGLKNGEGTVFKPEQNNPSTINPSTKDSNMYEEVWKLYPLKAGKDKAMKKIPNLIKKYGLEQTKNTVIRYIAYVDHRRKTDFKGLKYQNGSTFFNSTYVDYLDESYIPIEETRNQTTATKERVARVNLEG